MALKSISNSIVLDANGPDFLSRTLGAPTDNTTWTLSFWVKRGLQAVGIDSQPILTAGTDASNYTLIYFVNGGGLAFRHVVATSVIDLVTTQIAYLNDPTAWYHIVVTYDSNEGAAADRIKFWSNGIRCGEFNSSNFPTFGANSFINTAVEHRIGEEIVNLTVANPSNGYLSDVVFVDGTALTPSDFGEMSSDTWQPTPFSPTFGDNGFALEFATDFDLGSDTSGESNDFFQNSIDTANQREDSPSQNHVTLNALRLGRQGFPDPQLDFGSLRFVLNDTAGASCFATAGLPKTGKYYWEVKVVTASVDDVRVGVVNQLSDPQLVNGMMGLDNHSWAIRNSSGTVLEIFHDSGVLSTFTDTGTIQTGDYVQFAFDTATGRLWFGINGTFLDSGDPGAGTGAHVTLTAAEVFGALIPAVSLQGTAANRLDFRAGTEDLEGSVPTGFVTLRVDDWPDASITKPSNHFTFIEWQGDNTSPRAIAGAAFTPDLVWVKDVASTGRHLLSDITKGAGTVHYNHAAIADDAASLNGEISVFETDGISVVDGATNGDDVNLTGRQYVAMLWAESALAGLDLVGYVGAAAPQNIAHALGTAPDFMYVRNRDTAAGNEVYFGNTIDATEAVVTDPETDSVQADTTALRTDSAAPWDDTAPDASNFRVGSATSTNTLADNHQAYLFAEVEGFSKIGGYLGSGGGLVGAPFIYLGFRPKAVLIKSLNDVDDWALWVKDGEFNNFNLDFRGYQIATQFWRSNLAEGDTNPGNPGLYICASGFSIRQLDSEYNQAGSEYAYIAWAEVPFQIASSFAGPPTGAGALDLNFEIDAVGDQPNNRGDGDLNLSFQISASGTGGLPKGAGALDLGLEITATGTVPPDTPNGAGALELKLGGNTNADATPQLGIDGQGRSLHPRGDGALELKIGGTTVADPTPQPGIDSQAFNTAIRGPAVTLPQLSTTGSQIEQSTEMVGAAITLPLLQMGAVTILNANPVFGSPSIPVLATEGEINPDFDVDLPLLEVNGTILGGTTLRGVALPLSLLQSSGTLVNPQTASGFIILPQLSTTGSTIATGAVVSAPGISVGPLGGGMNLPALEANGFLLIPQEMAGTAITLPVIDIGPLSFIAPGSVITGSVILPTQRLDIVLVNGATLTATVWAMNTETLETTNYLNFDFVSLVSFADQPYGVTAGGIFLLEGDDDDGTNIDARVLTGISDRGDEALKEASHMYMQYDGGAMMFQLFPDGQQRLREYRFERRSNSSGVIHARAKGSRGLRSRSWQMGLRNLGGDDFTLDKLGLLLRALTRNTRKN